MALQTIKSSREIDRLFRHGRRAARRNVTILAAPSPEYAAETGRVAFIAGRRMGSAVRRNRSKRVLRAAARSTGAPWPGWDVALIANPRTADVAQEAILRDLAAALDGAGVR